MANFRGFDIRRVDHDRNRNRDMYYLYDVRDQMVATMSRHELQTQPQLRSLPHGRYRRPDPDNDRSAARRAEPDSDAAFARAYQRFIEQGQRVRQRGLVEYYEGTYTGRFGSDVSSTVSGLPRPSPFRDGGVVHGELTGYRVWRVDIDNCALKSTNISKTWLPQEVVPGEPRDEEQGLTFGGLADPEGVYAFKDLGAAEKWGKDHLRPDRSFGFFEVGFGPAWGNPALAPPRPPTPPLLWAVGSVQLWGKVYEHSHGYRASQARLTELYSVRSNKPNPDLEIKMLEALQMRYCNDPR